jgi:17beta-estradiol 17-dehydrogenase / very-long-chain 3-oxoacyl-CoA reductase
LRYLYILDYIMTDCWCVSLIGYAALALLVRKFFVSFYQIVFPYLFAVPQNLRVLAGGDWAVVTGSTDGIGKAYAFELAKKNFHLVLISRTAEKLREIADEITKKYNHIQVKTIAFDFTSAELNEYESKIFTVLNELEVGVLVNNVGMSYEYPEKLHAIEGGLKRVRDITVINTVPTTVLSAYILKQMTNRNNRGVIINLASSAGCFPMSCWAVYSATKKYVCWLSEVMRKEYSDTAIVVQTVCPMMVATKMAKIRKTSFFTPSPEQFAKEAVKSIGLTDETTGCFAHQIQAEVFFGWVPKFVVNKITTDQSMATRKRALKKKEDLVKNE